MGDHRTLYFYVVFSAYRDVLYEGMLWTGVKGSRLDSEAMSHRAHPLLVPSRKLDNGPLPAESSLFCSAVRFALASKPTLAMINRRQSGLPHSMLQVNPVHLSLHRGSC